MEPSFDAIAEGREGEGRSWWRQFDIAKNILDLLRYF
jgi:hypothetical protein